MFVINRKGQREDVNYSKIIEKIGKFAKGLEVETSSLADQIIQSLYPGISTPEIDRMTCKLAYTRLGTHKDYGTLAAHLYVDNIHRMTTDKFSQACTFAQNRIDLNGNVTPTLDEKYYRWIMSNARDLDTMVKHERDYLFSYPALQMAEDTYLISLNYNNVKPLVFPEEGKTALKNISAGQKSEAINRILNETGNQKSVPYYGYERENGSVLIDRIQYAILRVCVQCYYQDEDPIPKIRHAYDLYSQLYFTHPTPAILNSGKTICQLFSCFILDTPDDLNGIYNTLTEVANISKRAGGIAVNIADIRSGKKLIRSTNGMSSDLFNVLQLFNNTASYVNQGGVRAGNIAVYCGLEHPEIRSILQYRDPSVGEMKKKTLHLFYSMWANNLFFKRLKHQMETGEKTMWSLFDPDTTPGLSALHGSEYEKQYLLLEEAKVYVDQIEVNELFGLIVKCIYNTGIPYMCCKDAVNFKSNHQNRGVIKASNLCTEIMEYFDIDNPACCVLASICLNMFVTCPDIDELLTFDGTIAEARVFFSQYFNFGLLAECVKLIVHNLNRCIMVNTYPLEKLKKANIDYKPLAIGVQGLAKAFALMRVPFRSKEGRLLNMLIFETIYYAGLEASCDDVSIFGKYKDFESSPLGHGLFQFDMWKRSYTYAGVERHNTNPNYSQYEFDYNNLTLDWEKLRSRILVEGCANSLITSLMPTVSTSVFMNNADSECFEPFGSFVVQRKLLYGSVDIFNDTAYTDLLKLGLWNDDFFQKLKTNMGLIDDKLNSEVGGIIPAWMIKLYESVWSPGMTKTMIDYSRDRGPYIDQSQSLNLYFREDSQTYERIYRALVYAWTCDLKTMSYYIRSKLDPNTSLKTVEKPKDEECRLIIKEDGTKSFSCCSG